MGSGKGSNWLIDIFVFMCSRLLSDNYNFYFEIYHIDSIKHPVKLNIPLTASIGKPNP